MKGGEAYEEEARYDHYEDNEAQHEEEDEYTSEEEPLSEYEYDEY